MNWAAILNLLFYQNQLTLDNVIGGCFNTDISLRQ